MGTQGIVSVVREDQVIYKVIAGCNGMMAPKLADAIRKHTPETLQEVHDLAIESAFGCYACLVSLSKEASIYKGDDELNQRFFTTFLNPKYNPRWERGSADYVKIVELQSSCQTSTDSQQVGKETE